MNNTEEQDAAHSFEADFHVTKEQFQAIKEADVIRLTDGQEYVKKEVAAEIMKLYTEDLRAELTRLRSELQQAKQEITNHIAVNSLLTDSDGEVDLANKLYKATSELQQKDEVIKELVEVVENYVDLEKLAWPERIKSLIKKAKLNSES